MSKFSIEFKESIKTGSNRLGNLIENPFRNFAASKISSAVKPLTVVEYTDMFGKLYRIPVRNKTQMREAQLYLSIFKKECATLKQIVSEYPIVMGRIPKKFLSEFRSDIKRIYPNVNGTFINKLAGY
jgi:hypothetical protein